MAHEFAQDSVGMVIAGEEGSHQIFQVRKQCLERSPIIKGWIEDPKTMPESLKKDGALYFRSCHPDVVSALVKYLERDEATSSEDDFANNVDILQLQNQDPLFYIRVYKLAGSLAVESLCVLALNKIQSSKYSTEAFIKIVVEAEQGKLIDGSRFRNWIIAYVKQHYEALSESRILQTTIMGGGSTSWVVCSALLSCVANLGSEADAAKQPRSQAMRSTSNPFPTSTSYSFSPSSSSKSTNRPASISHSTRHSKSYSKNLPKSPEPKNSYRVEKKYVAKKRTMNATVEDAPSSDGDD